MVANTTFVKNTFFLRARVTAEMSVEFSARYYITLYLIPIQIKKFVHFRVERLNNEGGGQGQLAPPPEKLLSWGGNYSAPPIQLISSACLYVMHDLLNRIF